jgi:hypothetical protein
MRPQEISVNGVRIGDAPAQAQEGEPARRVITLPSGRVATVRKGFGRDLMRAQRAGGASGEPSAVVFALVAELAEIDGAKVLYEDVLAMELGDVLALQAEVAGENFQLPPPAPSLPSSTSGSR